MPASLPISVFYCFPRSGGTLLSQCLLSEKSTVVLSEVNPAGSFLPVERQAQEWFKLITPEEARTLGSQTYLEKISIVYNRCAPAKRQLCIRDWPAINFVPGLSPLVPEASSVLEQRWFLEEAGYTVRDLALLRRSRDVYRSMRTHIPGFQDYPAKRFAQHYGCYLAAIADRRKFYLEDFTRDPAVSLRQICEVLALKFPPRFQEQFHQQEHVTGNNTLPVPPPSARCSEIKTIRPRREEAVTARDAALFAELDALAGYAGADR